MDQTATRTGKHQPLLFDHYVVERILGTGAMGIVYLARDLRLGRYVALKTLHDKHQRVRDDSQGRAYLERFRREAAICASLIHPNIVTLYEVGFENTRLTYLAMEYVEGESLLSLLRRSGRVPLDAALKITADLLRGLSYAHDRGVIHRDMKPANILVSVDRQAKIADFGIARSARKDFGDLTEHGQLLGTPFYMAPEHVAGRTVDARADLFSVGVVLFEMLAGQKPFDGDAVTDVLYNVVNQPLPNLSALGRDVPLWCQQFLEKLTAKSPADRFLSATAATSEIERLIAIHEQTLAGSRAAGTFSVLREVPGGVSLEGSSSSGVRRRAEEQLLRVVPNRLALPLVASLAIAVILSWSILTRQVTTESVPAAPAASSRQLDEKRLLLHEARVLADAGAYANALQRYDAYLAQYPGSRAATEEREQLIERQNAIAAAAPAEVNEPIAKPRRETKQREAVKRKTVTQRSSVTADTPVAAPAEASPATTTAPAKESLWKRLRKRLSS